ncbi:ABC transporter [Niabella ginsenosidivorans]|uniref:ABC transporter n=1 Tax=Niabella ginsenosidivorans TaxID=1176587 RepID=A0A1A9I6V4_9BACT|nr:ABC transporter permease [Niabella ginsenosidivorans]ANH82779.1 ABC transporter [Niabella ginsenosidivorans]
MKSVINILKREIRFVSAQKALVLIFLIAPIAYAFMYGSIYANKLEEKVKIAVVDMDGSELSRMIATQLNATQMADAVYASDLNDAEQQLYHGAVQGYLFLEKGLQEKVLGLQKATVTLAVNASRFLPSSDLTATLSKISLTLGAGIRMKYISKQGTGNEAALQQANPLSLDYRPLYNETSSYGAFLLPGLLAIILQQTLLIGLVAGMGIEREQRFSGLFRMGNSSAVLLGKGIFYLVIFLIIGLFFVTINFTVLRVPMRGSGFSLLLLSAVFIAALIPMGLFIGSFFRSPLMGMQVMAFSSYPIFLITGYSMPYHSLPRTVQWLSALLPTTPFLKSYQSVVQAGGNLLDNKEPLLHLLLLWAIYCFLFLWRFSYVRKRIER